MLLFSSELTQAIRGYQINMEGKEGSDFGKSRCFILQLQNNSSIIINSYVNIYYHNSQDISCIEHESDHL